MKIEKLQSEESRRLTADMIYELDHGEILLIEVDDKTFISPSRSRRKKIYKDWDVGDFHKLRVVTPSNTFYWSAEACEIMVFNTPTADGGLVNRMQNWSDELYVDIARAQYKSRMALESFPELIAAVQSFAEKAMDLLRQSVVENPWQKLMQVQLEIPHEHRDQGGQFTSRETGRIYPPKFHEAVIMLLETSDCKIDYTDDNAITFTWNINPITKDQYSHYVGLTDADTRLAEAQQRDIARGPRR